jgi:hypothetical protein
MSIIAATSIVTSGLVFCIDPSNKKSYKINLANYSTYNASNWINIFPAGATLTTGIDDPFGGNNAIRFACNNSTNALLRVTFNSFTPSGTTPYVVSFYARKISGSSGQLSCDLTDATPSGDYTSQLITGQWVRIQVTATPTATARGFFDLLSDSTNNYTVDYYGLQIEPGTVASKYVETVGGPLPITAMYDLSENNNNSTSLTTVYSTVANGTLSFDGSTTYISVPSPGSGGINIAGQITVEYWVYLNSITSGGTVPLMKGNHYNLVIYGTNSYSYADQSNYSFANYGNRTAAGIGTLNTWTHIVVTKNSSNLVSVYVNGVLVDSVTFGSAIATSGSTIYPLWIGGYSDSASVPTINILNGKIGLARIYSLALTADQVAQNFNAHRSRFGL